MTNASLPRMTPGLASPALLRTIEPSTMNGQSTLERFTTTRIVSNVASRNGVLESLARSDNVVDIRHLQTIKFIRVSVAGHLADNLATILGHVRDVPTRSRE